MKKIFALLLVLCFNFAFFTTMAQADDELYSSRAYSIDELFIQDLGPDDCPNGPEGQHYWDGRITVIPSLTAEGEYTYTCRECGKTVKLRMQPAVSEYQIAAWQRSNPQAVNASDLEDQPEQPVQSGEVIHKGSGFNSISKLSQGQIRQLLASAPNFDFSAEELAGQKTAWAAVLARLNALRQLASLPAVKLDYSEAFNQSPDELIADSKDGNVETVAHRRWLLSPTMGEKAGDYDYIAWPSTGNFPSDIFSPDTPWSLTLNPEKFQTPDIFAVHVNIIRSMDGASWHFGGVNGDNYKVADSGKYYNVVVAEDGKDNCIIFRPDGIKEYLGSYSIAISGLRYIDGREVTISYDVEFFNLGPLDLPEKPVDLPDADEDITDNPWSNLPIPFLDVKSSDYFALPVVWANANGITKGASDTLFEPEETCTRGQIITFLWRAYGSPQSGIPNPFRDVEKSDYYYDAVLWGAEQGILAGNRFDGNAPCTRAMTVNYMWLAAGSPTPGLGADFTDVPANTPYNLAVAWAVEQGITTGASDTTFEPQQTCTRGQIVTFLYRNLADVQ